MGQRHQIFLRVPNIIKSKNVSLDYKEKKIGLELFGNGNTTVLAFYHGWLYGRSAGVNIINMINYTDKDIISAYNNPFSKDYRIHDNKISTYISDITNLLNVQPNKLHPRGIGFEKLFFLNNEDSLIREDFTRGDNNDGITIIDTIKKKYCMMNILDYDSDTELNYSASDLPYLKPVNALAYMKVYYGTTKKTINPYYTKGKTFDQIKEVVKKNFSLNNEIYREINKVTNGVLTLDDLKTIFPKYYKKSFSI